MTTASISAACGFGADGGNSDKSGAVDPVYPAYCAIRGYGLQSVRSGTQAGIKPGPPSDYWRNER